ncbi:unnamed protein product [Phaeothamnion confervicola]
MGMEEGDRVGDAKTYGSTMDPKTPLTATTEDGKAPPSSSSLAGIAFMALGSFSFACMFLLVKLVGPRFSTFEMVLYRSIVQLVLALAVLAFRGKSPLGPPDGRLRWLLLLRGSFGSFAVAAFFFATQRLPLPDAITLQFTTPVFAAAIAVCLVGEAWRPIDIAGAVVCMAGVLMIAHPSWLFGEDADSATAAVSSGVTSVSSAFSSSSSGSGSGGVASGGEMDDDGSIGGSGSAAAATTAAMASAAVIVGLLGAAMAGTAYVLVRKIGHSASAMVMVVYYAVASTVMCPFGSKLMGRGWGLELPTSGTELLCLVGMGFGGFGGQLFTNLGLQRETAATATLVANTQIVYSYIFEALILHETIKPLSVAGTCVIIAYMVLVGALKWRDAKHQAGYQAA